MERPEVSEFNALDCEHGTGAFERPSVMSNSTILQLKSNFARKCFI